MHRTVHHFSLTSTLERLRHYCGSMLEQIFGGDDVLPVDTPNSPMRVFFRGKTVFLTGGTGFLGKLFIEKLLRCEVREVILLIRSKRDRSPKERLKRQLEREDIYVRYAKNPESYWSKLRIVEGALEFDQLGLSEADLGNLRNNVDIVIHSAADVRFDVSLKTTIRTNVFGCNELLKIALGMRKLQSLLYISTAYSNCIHDVVEEKFYDDVNVDPLMMVRFVDSIDEELLDVMAKKIIYPWPNSYTYAKVLAEKVVRQYCDRLPVSVIRPSIVISTLDDPIEGWTDNVYGLNGVMVGAGVGVIRVLRCNDSNHADIIPADLVVNSCLAVIWHTTTSPDNFPPEDRVFNCTTRSDNPFTYEDANNFALKYRYDFPALQSLWFPTYNGIRSATLYYVLQLLCHFIPAVLFDVFARLKGIEPKVLFLYRKVQAFSDVTPFFTTNEWTFINSRMRLVYDRMSPDDRVFFQADIKKVQWNDFFGVYMLGLRKYILKESLDNVEQARRKVRKLKIAHYTILGLVYALLAYCAVALLGRLGFPGSLLRNRFG